jgi:hypothetical protein
MLCLFPPLSVGLLTNSGSTNEWYISSGQDYVPAAVSGAVTGAPMIGGAFYESPDDPTILKAYLGFGTTVSEFTFPLDSGSDNILSAGTASVVSKERPVSHRAVLYCAALIRVRISRVLMSHCSSCPDRVCSVV